MGHRDEIVLGEDTLLSVLFPLESGKNYAQITDGENVQIGSATL